MRSAATAYSWQRALLVGGDEGRDTRAALRANLERQGVVRVERALHTIAPGFRRLAG